MKIFITGATGLIGRELCKFLIHRNDLIVLSRNAEKAYQVLGPEVEVCSALTEVDFNEVDLVINLAGEPIADKRWSEAQKSLIMDSRINLTNSLSEIILACETPPHTLISGSAIGYYGRQPEHIEVDESFSDVHQEFSHKLCLEWESAALRAESEKTRVCILRTGIVLSEQGGALKKMLPAFKFGLGGPMASGKQIMSWIHIDDMTNLILFIIKHTEVHGVFNATAPSPVSNIEFTKILARVLNRPAFFTMPECILKILFGEMSDLLIFGQKVQPKRALDLNYRFRYDSLPDALENLLGNRPSNQ